jgi:transketolase
MNHRSTCHEMGDQGFLLRQGVLKLLAIKDSDIRILTLEQSRTAVDKGIHAGGALSAVIPLVALYYGGIMDIDVEEPTRRGQDLFVLSKGHAVAALASIFAELGYFDAAVLRNSRSYESILNGHPGPVLPGVHVPTGPLGQGFGVAQGFALMGRNSPRFDTFCLAGDGELQEGVIWEAVMFAAHKRLDNLCLMIDQNNGQLDIVDRLIFPLPALEPVFQSFGWRTKSVDATQYDAILPALQDFKYGPRNGQPTAIICRTTKGQGGFSNFFNRHKVEVPEKMLDQELAQQAGQRQSRVAEFTEFFGRLGVTLEGKRLQEQLIDTAERMRVRVAPNGPGGWEITPAAGPVHTRRAARRDKQIRYKAAELPRLDKGKSYAASEIVTAAMKAFAVDTRVVSIDADLASTSGLEAGVAAVAQNRALNVGVAEANMMLIGEACAAMGCNAWVSTFCPFFDWKVLRRIAVDQQERLEAIADPRGWLSEGHGLDLTFLATAANLETRTNGATHMGNDDNTVFDGIAHLKFIDVSCPQQLLGVMEWIMAGNRGLVYLRVMRAGSGVIYQPGYEFEFGRGHVLEPSADKGVVIISSGRGVHEALAAASECGSHGLKVGVVDMPSIDEGLLLELYDSGQWLCFAEQNNGYIWRNFQKILFLRRKQIAADRLMAVNTLGADAKPQFIHSGSYPQLLAAFGLAPPQLAETIRRKVNA